MTRVHHWQRTIRFCTALALIAGAAFIGFQISSNATPDWIRSQTESALSNAVEAPVSVQHARILLNNKGLLFSAQEVETNLLDGTAPLSIQEIQFELRIFPLLVGKIQLRKAWVLGLALDLPLSKLPPPKEKRPYGQEPSPLEPLWPGLLSEWGLPLGLVALQLQESSVRIFNQPEDGDEDAIVVLNNIYFEARRRTLRHDTMFEISAETEDAAESRGRGSFQFNGTTSKSFTGQIEINRAEFGPALRWMLEDRNLSSEVNESGFRGRGKVSGFIDIDLDASRSGKGEVRLKTEAVELDLPGGGLLESLTSRETSIIGTLALEHPSVSLSHDKRFGDLFLDLSVSDTSIKLRESTQPEAEDSPPSSPAANPAERIYFDNISTNAALLFSRRSLTLESAKLETAEMRIDLGGSLEFPVSENSDAEFSLLIEELSLDQFINFFDHLPPSLRTQADRLVKGLEAGTLHDFSIEYQSKLAEAIKRFEADAIRDLTGFRVGFRLSDGRLGFPSEEALKDLQGAFELRDDSIQISGLSATHGTTPLPTLDVTVEGLNRLLDEETSRHISPVPVGPIPGLEPLLGILFPTKPRPNRKLRPISVELDWVYHPTLLWPVEELNARITPKEDSIAFPGATLTWGGTPIIVDGHIQKKPEPHIDLAIRTLEGDPPSLVRPNEDVWIQGRWDVTNGKIGHWPYHRYGGSFKAIHDAVDADLEILLEPEGKLSAEGVLRLTKVDSVPITADVKLENGNIGALGKALTKKTSRVTGTLDAEFSGAGKLVPGDTILHHTISTGTLLARDGRLTTRLPLLVAIARASGSFNPFGSRKYLDYKTIKGRVGVDKGELAWEELLLKGSDLRLLLSGQMGLLEKDPPVEAIVGVLLFGKIDDVIAKIPLVNRILLGKDKNLLGTYFKVEGTRSNLKSSIIPTKALTFGPTDLVFGALPNYVTDLPEPEPDSEAGDDKTGSQ